MVRVRTTAQAATRWWLATQCSGSASIAPDGWLGRTIREIDPEHSNVITGINFGRGLPRALHAKGVPVASVGNLETYGLLPDIADRQTREMALDVFSRMYGPNDGGIPLRGNHDCISLGEGYLKSRHLTNTVLSTKPSAANSE